MRVGLLLIATGEYDRFLKPLIDSADRFFFKGEPIDIYIFADKPYNEKHSERINIQVMEIKHYPFPYATLYRYKHFDQYKDVLTSDYLFYLDVDMLFVDHVGSEILGDLVCVQHPGFYKGGWGSSGCDKRSLAYLEPHLCKDYKAGGFQGGRREGYLEACNILNARIQDDERRNVMAEWHDETHWNWYLKTLAKNIKILSPSYCFPQAIWAKGMLFQKKILALEKNHAEVRK
jgi:hypothetical protein